MNTQWTAVALVALLATTGCATKKYVEQQVATTQEQMTERIEGVEGQVEANQTRLDEQEQMIEDASKTAKDALDFADYQPMFADLNIVSGERTLPLPAGMPLFQQVLGAAWAELPAPVRNLHDLSSDAGFSGRASVTRGRSLLARMVGRIAGFPEAGNDVNVTVEIATNGECEIWQRNFSGHAFSSEMRVGDGWLAALMCERFGPIRLGMALVTDGDALHYAPRRWTFFGLPMPKALMPSGKIFETVVDGKFVFHVEITLPFIGNVVTYDGWLEEQ